jgi:HSP20 family molecular chaperone IbpA
VRISRLFRRTPRSSPSPIAFPEVDLYDSPREVVLRVETHDLEPRDIEIHLKGSLLTLVGKEESGGGSKSPTAAFRRSVVLPEGVIPSEIKARYKGKRLVIRIPKNGAEANPSGLDKAVKL